MKTAKAGSPFLFQGRKRKETLPAERGDLGAFNEENGSQAVFLQSALSASQHDSQRDPKYIKV